MVKRNSFTGKFLYFLSAVNDFLGRIGKDVTDFLHGINQGMERLATILTEDIPAEYAQYKEYRKRICHLCDIFPFSSISFNRVMYLLITD